MIITYCYPVLKPTLSFSIIARNHIRFLRLRHVVREVDVDNLRILRLLPTDTIILHPVMYPFVYVVNDRVGFEYQVFKIRSTPHSQIVAFDVADTDHISSAGRLIVNSIVDKLIVPSSFSREVFVRSGVSCRVYVLPHGLSDKFLSHDLNVRFGEFKILRDNGRFKFLYFAVHSAYRKGMDIVFNALSHIRDNYRDYVKDIMIVVRCNFPLEISFARSYERLGFEVKIINRFLSEDELLDLYCACDCLLLPSRGGGFELNGLEALALGKPIIYTEGISMDDYAKGYGVAVKSRRTDKPLFSPHDIAYLIHDGHGYECDPVDLAEKMIEVVNDYEKYRDRALTFREKKLHEYSWSRIVGRLEGILYD